MSDKPTQSQQAEMDARMATATAVVTNKEATAEALRDSLREILLDRQKMESDSRHLLKMMAGGDPRPCKKCGCDVYFVKHPATRKPMPLTCTGLNHFADCPNAGSFRG